MEIFIIISKGALEFFYNSPPKYKEIRESTETRWREYILRLDSERSYNCDGNFHYNQDI